MQGENSVNRSELDLAMLGHELRNVLSGVVGLTELLDGSGLNTEQQLLVGALRQSGRQMHWLIESVGYRGNKRAFPFEPQPRLLNGIEMLEQLVRCHTPAAIQNGNLLLLTVDPAMPSWWFCDERLLRLLLDNLLGNAIKFTCSGEVVLTVDILPGEQSEPAGLEIKVRDSGPGIAPDAQARIFEPWVQLDNRNQVSSGGVGLGLYVCQRIISELQGTLDYSCNTAGGSCFRVCLPGVVDSKRIDQNTQPSSLISSLECLVSARNSLRHSLEALLSRLGIEQAGSRFEDRPCSDGTGSRIRLSEQTIHPAAGCQQTALLLTHHVAGDPEGLAPLSRLLPLPILESTLGPVLMEMALDLRMSLAAEATTTPVADDMPDSAP